VFVSLHDSILASNMFVCVCLCEREKRKRDRDRDREREGGEMGSLLGAQSAYK
jgi:hypothetical protein